MAVFNFRATEDSTPGSGVYKVGTGNRVVINPSDYPDVNLSSLTVNNFFKRTVCHGSGNITNSYDDYANVEGICTAGSARIASYQVIDGKGVVTISETPRNVTVQIWVPDTGYVKPKYGSTSYTHTVYMSKSPIIER